MSVEYENHKIIEHANYSIIEDVCNSMMERHIKQRFKEDVDVQDLIDEMRSWDDDEQAL